MRKSILALVFFSLSYSTFAQSPIQLIDSLKILLKQPKTLEEKVLIYAELTWYYSFVSLDSAVFYGKQEIELAKKSKDPASIAQAHSDIANAYLQMGEWDLAKFNYKTTLSIRESISDSSGIAAALTNLGSVYQRAFQLDSAMRNYLLALAYFERTQNERYLDYVRNNIGVLHEDMRNYQKSIEVYEKVAAYREKVGDPQQLCMIYNNLANSHKNLKQYEKSEDYFKKAIEFGKVAGDSLILAATYNNLATLLNAMKKSDEAIDFANKGIQIASNINAVYDHTLMLSNLARSYRDKKEYAKSKSYYLQSLEGFNKLGALEDIASMYLLLVPVYAALNMPDSSQYYTDQYIEYRNSLTEKEIEQLTAELETKYETEKKDREILQQQVEIKSKNTQLFGSLALAIILGIVGYLLYSQQKLKNRQLQQEGELKSALAQIETQNKLQDQRLLISRDLHDNIGAQLTFIISAIENLKYFDPIKEQLTQRYDTIANFTKQTITELRDTIWAMNAGQVSWEQLSGRISDYLQRARLSDEKMSFEFLGGEKLDSSLRFDSASGIQIYRVLQEAIQNAIKYAEATDIQVTISHEKQSLTLQIKDNGKGFDESVIRPGNGLFNMRKRAEELGGELEIKSEIGKGTAVSLRWPFQ